MTPLEENHTFPSERARPANVDRSDSSQNNATLGYTRELSRLWKELEANGLAKAIIDAEFPYPIPPYPPSLEKEYVEQMGTLLESARGYAAEASAIASDPIVMNNSGLSEQFSTLAYGLVSLVADIEHCLIWKAAVEYLEL